MSATERTTKEEILNRLHQRVGICSFCGEHGCKHGTNTELPTYMDISVQDVLWAIDLDGLHAAADADL